ncbi:hypothetical protein J5X07_08010 [Actinomyces bowdenii]|uniref:Thiopeptide-type bacteriocin biosynthesis domain-containing protein n=1 Tax=Actinomyces bowdenii TaxID=131109 RepID=A0A3P1V584_9ACTO|nr:lantibiotic dehydratase C-terminal domain-containing protein [Actinomyces bowdenii]MBO3724969.1 hypothetical protein [Actinomyces bowdenii]RRD28958.1 hypothetical protein EII10_08355 [Actinomyces bowdenii]
MTDPKRSWHCWHAYLPHSRANDFLTALRAQQRSRIEAHDFFFLRYWQGGPHVRVRFRLEAVEAAEVLSQLADLIPALSQQDKSEYAHQVEAQEQLARLEKEAVAASRPPGTVEPHPYAPEYAKYGGAGGVAIAEDLFCSGTCAVLDLLAAAEGGPFDPLGAGLGLTAEGLAGTGLDGGELVPFLRRYADFWMGYAPWFDEARLKPVWKSIGESVMTLLARSAELSPGVGEAFAIATRAFGQAAGTDQTRLDTVLDGAAFGSVLSNYIHTNNNRLGLRPDQEIVVALLLARALEAQPEPPAGTRS